MRIRAAVPVLAIVFGSLACGDDGPAAPALPEVVWRVEAVVPPAPVLLLSGRRSPQPFRFRVVDGAGVPVPGARLPLRVEPEDAGYLSQSVAVTDSVGIAESYLLEPRPGDGRIVAASRLLGYRTPSGLRFSGDGETTLEFGVERAPGSLEFGPGSGAIGYPGLAHPDSVLRVRLLDTEGDPMPGRVVLFAAPGALSAFADSTDADGWAETRLRATGLVAGENRVFAFVSGFSSLLAQTTRPTVAPAQRVVLVSVDGLRTDAVTGPDRTTFARLRSGGASGTLVTVDPALTVPAHLSMLSGVPPSEHRVYSEDLQFTPEMNALDPAFRVSVQTGGVTAAFTAVGGPLSEFEEILECRLAFGFESFRTVAGGAGAIVDAALPSVVDTALSAVFVHLPDPDAAGHAHGFTSPEYAAAVGAVDVALGRLLDALPDGTLLVVTSDHGGGGAYGEFQHGSTDPIDTHVPVFLYGPGAVPGGGLPGLRSILDVAPTLLWATGIQPPAGYRGAPILAGFRNP